MCVTRSPWHDWPFSNVVLGRGFLWIPKQTLDMSRVHRNQGIPGGVKPFLVSSFPVTLKDQRHLHAATILTPVMARQDWRSGLWRLVGAMGFMCFGRISETQIPTELAPGAKFCSDLSGEVDV